jgi:hypothetical protein
MVGAADRYIALTWWFTRVLHTQDSSTGPGNRVETEGRFTLACMASRLPGMQTADPRQHNAVVQPQRRTVRIMMNDE